VQSATKLLIFDAIDYGLQPGTLKVIENEDVPRFMGAKKMSLHQTGFQEVLCVAQLTGHYPEQVVLIGCQPEELDDYGGSLRPVVRQAMHDALAMGLQRLRSWGVEPSQRDAPLPEDATLTGAMLTLDRYESERPSAEQACRIGDDRFIPKAA
jgi:hydrogenase maturation protease